MDTTTETLAHLVLRVRDEVQAADPHNLAKQVLADLDPVDYHAVLAEILPGFVRNVLGRERALVTKTNPAPADEEAAVANGGRGRSVGVSKKARAVEWWQRFLGVSVDTSPNGSGVWKLMGDCTRRDLLNAATFRRSQASSLIAVAGKYERVAALLTGDDVAVSTLDSAAVAAVYGVVQ